LKLQLTSQVFVVLLARKGTFGAFIRAFPGIRLYFMFRQLFCCELAESFVEVCEKRFEITVCVNVFVHPGKKCNFSNPCLRHVCHNGGTCVAVSIPVDPPMAACQCASGYSGPTCM